MRISNKNHAAALEDLKNMTYEEVGAKYGVSKTTLVRWRAKAKLQDGESVGENTTLECGAEQLSEKNEQSVVVEESTGDLSQSRIAEKDGKDENTKTAEPSPAPDVQTGSSELTPYSDGTDADEDVLELVAILATQIEKLKQENRALRRSLRILLE